MGWFCLPSRGPSAGSVWVVTSGSCYCYPVDRDWDAAQHLTISHTTENYPAPVLTVGFLGGEVVKNPPASTGDVGSIPGLGRSAGGGNGNLLQNSCLENSMDIVAWWATAHGVSKSWTSLNMHAPNVNRADFEKPCAGGQTAW